MITYTLRRLFSVLPVLAVVSLLVFSMMRLAPGDPVLIYLGEEATEEAIEEARRQLGLERPLYIQYFLFLKRIFTLELGYSVQTQQPVVNRIIPALLNSAKLAFPAMILSLLIGVAAGALSAAFRPGILDSLIISFSILGASAPMFWTGLVLIIVVSVHWKLLPAGGGGSFAHLILPAISLGLPYGASIARLCRSKMLEVLAEDYITTARAKGLSEKVVLYSHALRNSLIPVISIAGVRLGMLLGGSLVVETVFAYPGLGRLLIEGILMRDYALVQGGVLILVLIFTMVNLLADLAYGIVDPRIKYGSDTV